MKESDVVAFGTCTRFVVNQADALFFCMSEAGLDITDCESDMVYTFAARGYEVPNRSVRVGGFEQFQFCLANFKECGFHFLVFDFF